MADSELDRLLAQYAQPPPPTLGGGPPPLPEITLTQPQAPLGQHNLVDRALSSFGQPSLDKLEAAYRGEATPRDVAWEFLTNGPMGPLGGVRVRNPIRAYHVSPHTYDKPSLDHIGTGEGAYAYGRGLYGAESPAVRDAYYDIFLHRDGVPPVRYDWNIHARPEQFLDWHTPLARQSPEVREALTRARIDLASEDARNLTMRDWADMHDMARESGVRVDEFPDLFSAAGTETLRAVGIPGLRYQGRDIHPGGAGTNYTIWSPEIIEILRRYGVAGPIAAPALLSQYDSAE